jgi:hypothetical protein
LEYYLDIVHKFIEKGWFDLCCTFQGHHGEILMLFAKTIDGFQTQVGNVLIHVTEHSIGAACHFPI